MPHVVQIDTSTGALPTTGTVTAIASGTQAVTGTVTAVPTGTQAISGTVTTVGSGTYTVSISNSPTVTTNADASIGAGTAPSRALIGGLVYNTSAPAPTNGQTVALQGDSSANLKIAVAATSVTQPVSGTVTTVGSGTYTVSGTVTAVPTGTQVVSGTVTAVPTGTQVVSGTVTTGSVSRSVIVTGSTTHTSASAQTLFAAQGVGVFLDITFLSIANSSASMQTVTISDGTRYYKFVLPANGGNNTMAFVNPLVATNANTAWTARITPSASTVYVNAVGIQQT